MEASLALHHTELADILGGPRVSYVEVYSSSYLQGMNGDGRPGDSYNGPDSLRNTANKMFSRNIGERSSGYSGQQQQYQQQQQQQQYQQQQQLVQQQQLNQSQHSLNQSLDTSYQARLEEEAAKRNSYANQSFRAAIQQPGPKPGPGPKQPPQVPLTYLYITLTTLLTPLTFVGATQAWVQVCQQGEAPRRTDGEHGGE